MSNLLKVAMIETILSLHQRGWSQRRIARELGIDRETVARYLRHVPVPAKPAIAPTGSADLDGHAKPAIAPLGSTLWEDTSKPAIALIGSGSADPPITLTPPGQEPPAPGRPSDCEPWRAAIQAKLNLGLSAQRLHQDLVTEHGFTGSYYSVRRFVRHLEQTLELPFRRLECGPGEEAQVDFGCGAPLLLPDGRRRRTHVFRIVLSHSRKAYSEAVLRQTTDDFLRCLENALWHFGGVPQRLVLDNLRAAVAKADWYDPDLNPKVRSFGQHYGLTLLPTRPYTPRHKGKVERGIDYVQENALKGRRFASLEEENQFLLDWERTVADTRIHGTTRRQVGTHFGTVERPALQRLPLERFPCFYEARRVVHRDGTSKSSVPITRSRRSTWPGVCRRAGMVGWYASSTTSWSRSPCMPGTSQAASARSRSTSVAPRSAASNAVPPGSWARYAGWVRAVCAGPRPCSRRAASRACVCCKGCSTWPTATPAPPSNVPVTSRCPTAPSAYAPSANSSTAPRPGKSNYPSSTNTR